MTPTPRPEDEVEAEDTSEDTPDADDPHPKGLDVGTLPGDTTSDRATGLTSPD